MKIEHEVECLGEKGLLLPAMPSGEHRGKHQGWSEVRGSEIGEGGEKCWQKPLLWFLWKGIGEAV